jgi:hypothetical protein
MESALVENDYNREDSAVPKRFVISYNDWTLTKAKEILTKYFDKNINIVIVNDLLHGLLISGNYAHFIEHNRSKTSMDCLMRVVQQQCWNCPSHLLQSEAMLVFVQNTFLHSYGSVLFFHTYYSRCQQPTQNALRILFQTVVNRRLISVLQLRNSKEAAEMYTNCFGVALRHHFDQYHGIDVSNITKGMVYGTVKGCITRLRTWIGYSDEYKYNHFMKKKQRMLEKTQAISYIKCIWILKSAIIEWSDDPTFHSISYCVKKEMSNTLYNSIEQASDIVDEFLFWFIDTTLHRFDHFQYDFDERLHNEKIDVHNSGLPMNYSNRKRKRKT